MADGSIDAPDEAAGVVFVTGTGAAMALALWRGPRRRRPAVPIDRATAD